jgi:hypothetical protein
MNKYNPSHAHAHIIMPPYHNHNIMPPRSCRR